MPRHAGVAGMEGRTPTMLWRLCATTSSCARLWSQRVERSCRRTRLREPEHSRRGVSQRAGCTIRNTTHAPLLRRSRLHQESIAGAEKEKTHPPANATGLPGGDYSARFFLTVPFSELRLAAELFPALTCEGFKQIEIHDEFLSTKPGFATARGSGASPRARRRAGIWSRWATGKARKSRY